MSRELSDLRSDVKVAAVEALADIKSAGVDVYVVCTSRSLHDQIALFAQGRCPLEIVNHLRMMAAMKPITAEENKYTVTFVDGITKRSAHQDGRAIDVVVMKNGKFIWNKDLAVKEYRVVRDCFKAHGFVSGANFPPLDKNGLGWDPGHAEMT